MMISGLFPKILEDKKVNRKPMYLLLQQKYGKAHMKVMTMEGFP